MQVPQDFTRETTLEDPAIQSPEDREKYYWQKDHVRLFGRDYPEWLRRAGFTVEEFAVSKEIDATLVERYRLQKEEILYIVKK